MDARENLNKLNVPLADVRMHIVELMKDGIKEMPLGDFIVMVQEVIRKSKAS